MRLKTRGVRDGSVIVHQAGPGRAGFEMGENLVQKVRRLSQS
jgi:hypothetical protein